MPLVRKFQTNHFERLQSGLDSLRADPENAQRGRIPHPDKSRRYIEIGMTHLYLMIANQTNYPPGERNAFATFSAFGSRRENRYQEIENSEFIHTFLLSLFHALYNSFGITPQVISGLCPGADRKAHQEAVKNQVPTIGANPSPINHPHPLDKDGTIFSSVLNQKSTGSGIVSLRPGIHEHASFSVTRDHYLDRNTLFLIGGFGLCYNISNKNSGAIYTALLMLKAGRPVFFIKGTVQENAANFLKEYGAQEIFDPNQIIAELQKKN